MGFFVLWVGFAGYCVGVGWLGEIEWVVCWLPYDAEKITLWQQQEGLSRIPRLA